MISAVCSYWAVILIQAVHLFFSPQASIASEKKRTISEEMWRNGPPRSNKLLWDWDKRHQALYSMETRMLPRFFKRQKKNDRTQQDIKYPEKNAPEVLWFDMKLQYTCFMEKGLTRPKEINTQNSRYLKQEILRPKPIKNSSFVAIYSSTFACFLSTPNWATVVTGHWELFFQKHGTWESGTQGIPTVKHLFLDTLTTYINKNQQLQISCKYLSNM